MSSVVGEDSDERNEGVEGEEGAEESECGGGEEPGGCVASGWIEGSRRKQRGEEVFGFHNYNNEWGFAEFLMIVEELTRVVQKGLVSNGHHD